MATEYDVKARLTMDARQATRSVDSYANRLSSLSDKIRGTQSAMGGMMGKVVALGAGYIGLQAGVRAFTGLTKSAVEYTTSLESTKIGLASILSAVNNLSYAAGQAQAGEAFDKIKELSITSPAGPKEMFGIFQGIVGPIRAAGESMGTVYKMTADTVLAAGALGVDLEQAQRDMSLMVRGSAGMDTKMFAIMKSMNLIKEDTETWNKKLTSAERVAKLQEAMKAFSKSGKAFGSSFAGVMSTFGGIVNEYKRAFMSPVLDVFAGKMAKLNDYFIANNEDFMGTLTSWGQTVGDVLGSVFDRGERAFNYLTENWDTITNRISQAMEVAQKYGPMIAKIAGGMAAVDMARGPAAMAVNAAAGVASAGSTVAGWMGGGAAVSGAAAGGGAAGGGVAAGGAAAGIALAPLAAVLAAIASIGVAVYENFWLLVPVFENLVAYSQPLVSQLIKFAKNMWGFLKPALEAVGLILISVLIPAWHALVFYLDTFVMPALELVGEVFKWIGEQIDTYVIPALRSFITWLGNVSDEANKEDDSEDWKKTYGKDRTIPLLQFSEAAAEREEGPPEDTGRRAPAGRAKTQINVDKMIIKQDFKGQKDPDRVLSMMLNDITKQAERRVSTRFTGALTR